MILRCGLVFPLVTWTAIALQGSVQTGSLEQQESVMEKTSISAPAPQNGWLGADRSTAFAALGALERERVLAEYRGHRETLEDTLEQHLEMADWCDRNGLFLQREAHLRRALRHSPENEQVHRALGHVFVDGAWRTREQHAQEQKKALAHSARLDRWSEPVLQALRPIRSANLADRESGWQQLDEIRDPTVLPALETILLPANSAFAVRTLDLIDRFEVREASEILLRAALEDSRSVVRDRALALLADRNEHDYVPALLRELRGTAAADYRITPDNRGNVKYQFLIVQPGMDRDTATLFDQDLIQFSAGNGARNQARFVADAGRRASQAMRIVDAANEELAARNRLVQNALHYTTGASPGDQPQDWWNWWNERNEVHTDWRTTDYREVDVEDVYLVDTPPTGVSSRPGRSCECLVAGTKIWTDRGPRPVESLTIGDLVQCLDLETGKVELQVVLERTTRPDTATWRIVLPGEIVQASGDHCFEVAGRGWTRTRDLASGMVIATAGGKPVAVRRIEPAESLPLFNLIVNRHSNYFVGQNRIVSHDGTLPDFGSPTLEKTADAIR